MVTIDAGPVEEIRVRPVLPSSDDELGVTVCRTIDIRTQTGLLTIRLWAFEDEELDVQTV